MLDTRIQYGDPRSIIWFQTDVPVHLFMQVTFDPPVPQQRFVTVRGVAKKVSTFWRMPRGVWFEQNEQHDTTTHSWYVDSWPPGVGMWYYLDGRQQGADTVSSSILFGSVRPLPNFSPSPIWLQGPILGTPLLRDVSILFSPTVSIAP